MDGYIDQSPDALRLTLVEGEVDRTQFHLLAEQVRELAGVQIHATVIGASHLITYSTEHLTFSEVFACLSANGVEDAYYPSQLSGGTLSRRLPGFDYSFTAWSVPWVSREPQALEALVSQALRSVSDSSVIGVVQDFPKGDLAYTPKTVITGRVRNGSIMMTTAHSYPNVPALMLSRSILAPDSQKK